MTCAQAVRQISGARAGQLTNSVCKVPGLMGKAPVRSRPLKGLALEGVPCGSCTRMVSPNGIEPSPPLLKGQMLDHSVYAPQGLEAYGGPSPDGNRNLGEDFLLYRGFFFPAGQLLGSSTSGGYPPHKNGSKLAGEIADPLLQL